MLVDLKFRDSEKAEQLIAEIQKKHSEINALCYELRNCLMLEAELKKEQPKKAAQE